VGDLANLNGPPTKIFRHTLVWFPVQQIFTEKHFEMAEDITQTTSNISTYHCLCSTLILVTPYDLGTLPRRKAPSQDHAIIFPLAGDKAEQIPGQEGKYAKSTLHNITTDRKGVIVRREDGFEKRVGIHCARCNLLIGYRIEQETKTDDEPVLFLLPGGLWTTKEMKEGLIPQQPSWATAKA
jgi:hypothetical protein